MVEMSSVLCVCAVVYRIVALAVVQVVFNCFRERWGNECYPQEETTELAEAQLTPLLSAE